MTPQREWVLIGKVGRPRGLGGDVFLTLFNQDSSLVSQITELALSSDDSDPAPRVYQVHRASFNGKRWVVKFEGLDRIEALEPITHQYVYARRAEFPRLAEGDYYHVDLVGLGVYDLEGVFRGTVERLYTVGAQDVVEFSKDGKLFACAWVKAHIAHVDMEQGRIVLHSEGIVDAL